MSILEIADELYRDLSSPTDLSVQSISFWIRGHIGDLNNSLGTSYELDEDTLADFTPELGDAEKAVLKKLYLVHYYDLKIRANLGAAAEVLLSEVTSDGATIRTVNKNEISKTYVQMKRLEMEDLAKAISAYFKNKINFQHIAGDDTIAGSYPSYNPRTDTD